MAGPLRVGVDIGGTFTDLCVLDDDGIVAVGKVLTTHDEPARAVEEVLREAVADHDLDPAAVHSLIHGTTLVTNALIERRGAPTALLTTEGFRDVLEMAREHRYELYDLGIEMPRPLVPRHLRHGVPERTLADGTVEQEVDVRHVQRLARELVDAGVEAVAVCFLHSHVDDRNERAARDAIAEVGAGPAGGALQRGQPRDPGVRAQLDHGRQRLRAVDRRGLPRRPARTGWPRSACRGRR